MLELRAIGLLVIGLASAAGGCDQSIAPIQVALGCPDQPLRGPEQWAAEPADRLIDDFEDGDVWLAAVAGRNGAWIRGWDETGVLTVEVAHQCAARGLAAGHFAGSGFTGWAANWTAVFRDSGNGTAVGYDVRSYSGISFWAASGRGIKTPYWAPVGITTVDVAWNGGICNGDGGAGCMDYYGTLVPLTSTWQRFVIRFDELKQSGTGAQFVMRRDQMVGFILWPREAFDIWIDDVRFQP